MIRYMVILEEGASSWGAYVPDLPGCVVVAQSREEAMRLIPEAVALHIQDLRDRGREVPKPISHGHTVEIEAA